MTERATDRAVAGTAVPAGIAVPAGPNTFSITWAPGSDTMLGICHCGARRIAEDPIELWMWLLGHPEGHGDGDRRHGDPGQDGTRV